MASEVQVPVFRTGQVPHHLLTANQLAELHRKRPADPRTADGLLEWSAHGQSKTVQLYDLRTAVTIADRPTPEQRRTDRDAAADWARRMLADPNVVVLDTEGTDKGGRVIEVAVVSSAGQMLLESLVNPDGTAIAAGAAAAHGITDTMVCAPGVPQFADLVDQLTMVLSGKTIIAWNAPYDQAVLAGELQQMAANQRYAPHAPWLEGTWDCAMRQHAAWMGDWDEHRGDYHFHRLDGGHRAGGDVREVLQRLAQMAATAAPTASPSRGVSKGIDVEAMRRVWPDVLSAVRHRSRGIEAMLTNAAISAVHDETLVVTRAGAPLVRRLNEESINQVVREALRYVLGGHWRMRCELAAPIATPLTPSASPIAANPTNSPRRRGDLRPAEWPDDVCEVLGLPSGYQVIKLYPSRTCGGAAYFLSLRGCWDPQQWLPLEGDPYDSAFDEAIHAVQLILNQLKDNNDRVHQALAQVEADMIEHAMPPAEN